jgi:AcrR family transcriptional regulator
MSLKTIEPTVALKENKRGQILKASFELFAENGYDRTSMTQIAKKARVSKGLIYNYFDGKETLLKELVTEAFNSPEAITIRHLFENKEYGKSFKALVDLSFNYLEKRPKQMKLMTKLSLQVAQFDFLKEIVHNKASYYCDLLEKLFSALGYKNPKDEAYIFSLLIDGLAFQAISMKDNQWFQACKEAVLRKYKLI